VGLSNGFVSSFSRWAETSGYPSRVRRRLPRLLRELPGRLSTHDERQTLFVRTLPNTESLRLRVETPVAGVYTSGDMIAFWAIGPDWRLRHLSPDVDTSDVVEDFLFFASQHALRSRILSSTTAVALAFDQLYDFRHADLQTVAFGGDGMFQSVSEAQAHVHSGLPPDGKCGTGRRSRVVRSWMARLNTIDPFIQRAVFQYWRARSLWQADFGEDAINALDGLSSVASEALNSWVGSGQLTRQQLGALLQLNQSDTSALVGLYELRCAFGAHPAASKWWDFNELYESQVELHFDTAVRLLGALSDVEIEHRSVDPGPERWSQWFEDNASMLLDAVWFARLP
jgi:hypothetical protein